VSSRKALSEVQDPIHYRGAMSVKEFIQWAGISRWLFYELVRRGLIHPKKISSRTVIFREEAERWARELPEAAPVKDLTKTEPE